MYGVFASCTIYKTSPHHVREFILKKKQWSPRKTQQKCQVTKHDIFSMFMHLVWLHKEVLACNIYHVRSKHSRVRAQELQHLYKRSIFNALVLLSQQQHWICFVFLAEVRYAKLCPKKGFTLNVLFSLFSSLLFLLFLHFSLFLAAWKTSPFFATNRNTDNLKSSWQKFKLKCSQVLRNFPPLSGVKFLNAIESTGYHIQS